MATRARCTGRKSGTRNKGYFFRQGRGWCASEGNRAIPLLLEDGSRIRNKNAPAEEVREAFARYVLTKKTDAMAAPEKDLVTVLQMCDLYLNHCQASMSGSTYRLRADALFDFCTGLPAAFRDKGQGEKHTKQEIEASRIHKGFGNMLVCQLLPLHVHQWEHAHPGWKGGKRTKIQALKRALNYGVDAGVLSRSPLKGYKVDEANIRKTYITPEQEAACYEVANRDVALAIRVCIRTGARYGCEFCKLTAEHVTINGDRMEWQFAADESKTKKLRIIRVSDPEIIAIVREQMRKYPSGAIFRNTVGYPWTQQSLKQAFSSLKPRLAKRGIQLDKQACMYSCRHTFAKRTLQGYWTGKPTNIETLSILMGNSREVCWRHYAEWCETYTEPLWEAV